MLDITLVGVKPKLWRRVIVRADRTLAQLHTIVQLAMGWSDDHLHVFTAHDGETFSDRREQEADGFEDDQDGDEGKVRVSEVLPHDRAVLRYTYDFGDSWEHTIKRVKVAEDHPGPEPFLVQGARACPPEDSGGVHGYADLLDAVADPSHPEHEEQLEWLGDPFDPEHFDEAAVRKDLSKAFRR